VCVCIYIYMIYICIPGVDDGDTCPEEPSLSPTQSSARRPCDDVIASPEFNLATVGYELADDVLLQKKTQNSVPILTSQCPTIVSLLYPVVNYRTVQLVLYSSKVQ
jgi:hypothetical protein